jgi:hypothetical protein
LIGYNFFEKHRVCFGCNLVVSPHEERPLKVQFEFSASDLAEVANRAADRSRVVRGWRLQGRMIWAVLISFVIYAVTPGQPTGRAVFAALICLLLAVIIPRLNRTSSRNNRMLRYYREQLGGDGPFVCEVELAPEGLITRQLGAETTHPWSRVVSASEASGGIEFIYRPMGALLVRDRAFRTPESREQFLALALRLIRSGEAASP